MSEKSGRRSHGRPQKRKKLWSEEAVPKDKVLEEGSYTKDDTSDCDIVTSSVTEVTGVSQQTSRDTSSAQAHFGPDVTSNHSD